MICANAQSNRDGRLRARLRERLEGNARVAEIRGRGLMVGVELVDNAAGVRDHALAAGVLVNVTQERVVRLLPPLIIDDDQTHQIADTVADGIAAGN